MPPSDFQQREIVCCSLVSAMSLHPLCCLCLQQDRACAHVQPQRATPCKVHQLCYQYVAYVCGPGFAEAGRQAGQASSSRLAHGMPDGPVSRCGTCMWRMSVAQASLSQAGLVGQASSSKPAQAATSRSASTSALPGTLRGSASCAALGCGLGLDGSSSLVGGLHNSCSEEARQAALHCCLPMHGRGCVALRVRSHQGERQSSTLTCACLAPPIGAKYEGPRAADLL